MKIVRCLLISAIAIGSLLASDDDLPLSPAAGKNRKCWKKFVPGSQVVFDEESLFGSPRADRRAKKHDKRVQRNRRHQEKLNQEAIKENTQSAQSCAAPGQPKAGSSGDTEKKPAKKKKK